MIISTFASQKDNEPTSGEATWEELVKGFVKPRVTTCTLANCLRGDCAHKAGPAWSPAFWPDGARRSSAGVEGVSVLVVDIDHVLPDELPELLSHVSQWQCVIHASHSDSPEDRCLRVVFAITRTVLPHEWARFWVSAMDALDLPVDTQTRDASRLYYLPSRPSDACEPLGDGTGYLYHSYEGEVVNVDSIMALAPVVNTSVQVTQITKHTADAADIDKIYEAAQTLSRAWPTAATGGRHQAHLALAGALARAGWEVDNIAEFMAGVAELAEPGVGKLDERLKIARASVAKIESGAAVTGWTRLEELVDSKAVQNARLLLGMGLAPSDPVFVSWVQEQANAGPTNEAVKASLESAAKKLRASSDDDNKYQGNQIKRVLQANEKILDLTDLKTATIAMIKAAPKAVDKQIIDLLRFVAPPEIVLADWVAQARNAATTPLIEPGYEPQTDEELRGLLRPDPDEGVRVCGMNVELILRYSQELKGRIRFNELTKAIIVTKGKFRGKNATLGVAIKNWLEKEWSCFASTLLTEEQLMHVAREYGSFDPVVEYLNSLKWDGVSRIDNMLNDYCGVAVEEGVHVKWFSSKFLISAVARALNPGCKVDTVLILEGNQGIGKSTALGILGGPWFSDTPMVLGDKDSRMLAAAKWIIELAELSSLGNKEVETHKAFLSSCQDDFRLPYSRTTESFPRRCVFAGSTNDSLYLRDATGARRFWPVRAGAVDTEALTHDRDQLWAEAVVRYLAGEQWWLSQAQQLVVDEITAQRRVEDPWASIIIGWNGRLAIGNAPPKTEWTMAEIASGALNIATADLPRHSKHLSSALREAGFEQCHRRVDGTRKTFWKRVDEVLMGDGGSTPQSQTSIGSSDN